MDRSPGWRRRRNRAKRHKDQHDCSLPWCCGNRRRDPWAPRKDRLTLQEQRAELDFEDQKKDVDGA